MKLIQALVTDAPGNIGTSSGISVALDQTAPVAPTITTTNLVTSGSTVSLSGT